MDYEKIGNLISSLRKEKGLTQAELANKLRVTDRAVSKWERGLGCPDVSLLDDLSRILDISIIEILKGRRLDKDEIIDNKKIIESMNYSKESTKNKIKDIVNKVIIGLIVLISLLLVFFNLKSIYYMNKTYYFNNTSVRDMSKFSENKKYIELIKNNQGIYSDEDYKKILDYIAKMEENLNKQKNEYYYVKDSYSFKEILDFLNAHNLNSFIYQGDDYGYLYSIYYVINQYDPNIIENAIKYHNLNTFLSNNIFGTNGQVRNVYSYISVIDNEIVSNLYYFIEMQYNRDSMLLKDIIKVGEMNE